MVIFFSDCLDFRQEIRTSIATDFRSHQNFALVKSAVAVPKLPSLPQPAATNSQPVNVEEGIYV